MFGLKANFTLRRLWVGCNFTTGKCKLDGCPGNRFKPNKQSRCKNNLVYITKVRGDDACLRVGDKVVLIIWDPVAEEHKTVHCNSEASVCSLSTACNGSMHFNTLDCHSDMLRLAVATRKPGDLLKHKDEISLVYAHSNSQFRCDLTGRKACRRRSCAVETTDEENNNSVEEDDPMTPVVETEHCNHTFTLYHVGN